MNVEVISETNTSTMNIDENLIAIILTEIMIKFYWYLKGTKSSDKRVILSSVYNISSPCLLTSDDLGRAFFSY